MTIRDHITKELGCYLLPMLKRVTLLHKYKLCKICPECLNMCGIYLSHLDMNFSKYWNLNWLTPNCPKLLADWCLSPDPGHPWVIRSPGSGFSLRPNMNSPRSDGVYKPAIAQWVSFLPLWTWRSAHLSYTWIPWCKWFNNGKKFCLRCLEWVLN